MANLLYEMADITSLDPMACKLGGSSPHGAEPAVETDRSIFEAFIIDCP